MKPRQALQVSLLSTAMVLALAPDGGAAQVTTTLRLPVYASPGQLWVGPGGELQGVRVRVLKELNARLAKDHIALQYVVAGDSQLSVQQAMKDTLQGKYEAYFGLIHSRAREDEGFVFGKEEIYGIPTVVFMRAGEKFSYGGLASLKGKRIGLVAGYPFLDDVKGSELQIDRSAADDDANVRNLLDGRVDVIIDNLTRTGTAIVRLKASDKVAYAREPFEVSRFLVAYNKTVSPAVVARVDGVLKAMRESGVIKQILEEAVYGPLKR
jgi:polar amino acid transport system substrate-binding protein